MGYLLENVKRARIVLKFVAYSELLSKQFDGTGEARNARA